MTSLPELKDRWFIDVNQEAGFPPQARHPGSGIQPHTDGNLVEPLIDGAAIMSDFYIRLDEARRSANPDQCFAMLASMGIDPVKPMGENEPGTDIKSLLLEAAEAGVNIYFLVSGQPGLGVLSQSFAKKLIEKGGYGAMDSRFPGFAGGHHQKFNILRGPDGEWAGIASSADFFFARWDTPDHGPENPNRSKKGGPTHDTGLKVRGPAVHDMLLSFAERWNDPSSAAGTSPPINNQIPAELLEEEIPQKGPHSVQVLRTYPIIKKGKRYSWSDVGEYTIWAAYLNAIKKARRYIYIEDQYLYTFHDRPYIETSTGLKRETDYVYQMGEALKRGVDIVALVPGRNNAFWKHYEIRQRRIAAQYLREISEANPKHGNFVICTMNTGGSDAVIHSKLLLVDDEYALIGSANICQRSIANLSELQLGVVDPEDRLLRDLRLALWQEHLELDSPDSLLDSRVGVEQWFDNAATGKGRLHSFRSKRPKVEVPYGFLFNKVVDPYNGPDRGS